MNSKKKLIPKQKNMDKTVLIIVLVVLIVTTIGIYYYKYEGGEKEGFWDIPSRSVWVDRGIGPDFYSTPEFQGILSPRFSNADYGATLRTCGPSLGDDTFGVPKDPLGLGCEDKQCGNEKENFVDVDAEVKPIVYDRYMFANRKSRLRSMGDHIRGDLPIAPLTGNWFVPNVHPNLDLQPGAINVMVGTSNETNRQLADLIYYTSGGTDTNIGGVDLTTTNPRLTAAAGGGDVIVTSFP